MLMKTPRMKRAWKNCVAGDGNELKLLLSIRRMEELPFIYLAQ